MIEVRDLWVHPPGASTPAVKGVSLRVAEGEWLALTGPNGCGKSSLALAVAGLWPARRGTVLAHGAPLTATPAGRAAAGIATVLQEPSSQLFGRTVAEELGFAARNLGLDPAVVERDVAHYAERFGLAASLARVPHELSAGEQQRVLMAAALATDPRILVVDEGAAHLDAASRASALEAIRERLARGTSVLWVTQDQSEIDAADRVVRLDPEPPSTTGRPARVPPPPGPRAERQVTLRIRIDEGRAAIGPRVTCGAGGVAFEVGPGEPVALTGRNGAGKSVALEAIAGVTPNPQVHVEIVPGAAGPPVFVSQFPELQIFGDTVREEIEFGVRRRGGEPGAALEEALQLLREMELGSDMLDRSPWDLSTGERRIVQIVAALVAPAGSILLDEPTCGLDPARAEALAGLLEATSRRIAVLVATQDKVLTSRIGARILALGG